MKCKHNYKLSFTDWEYPYYGTYGTGVNGMEQVAYLLCHKCLSVKKVLIEQVERDSKERGE